MWVSVLWVGEELWLMWCVVFVLVSGVGRVRDKVPVI